MTGAARRAAENKRFDVISVEAFDHLLNDTVIYTQKFKRAARRLCFALLHIW